MSYSCDQCNKNYKTYQSIWNHNKKFHNNQNIQITTKERKYMCIKCNKLFTRKDNMKNHMNNICKKNNELDKVEQMTLEIIELKNELKEIKTGTKTDSKIVEINNINNGIINNNIIYINEPYQASLDKLDSSSTMMNEPGEKVLTFSPAGLSKKSKDFLDNEPSSFESEDSKSRMLLNNLPSGKIVNEPGEKVLTFSPAGLSKKSKDFLDNEPYPAKLDKLNSSSMMMNEPGTENLLELTKDEIKEIFNKDITCILSYIEKVNFNDRLKTNHSFCTTNLGGAYLSVFDTNNSKIKQNRKKFFFDEIINIAVSKIEELYKLYKSYFTIEKQNNIETTLIKINELKNMDMNKRIYKEMLKQLNILSYNDKNIVENTWNNKNIKGSLPKTFEEDIEMYLTDNCDSD